MNTKLKGHWGEQQAADYLKRKKYRIVGLNFSSRFGEIDIIAEKREYIVFLEVKLRKDTHFAAAREFVTKTKQKKIIQTAALWLSRNNCEKQARFDVIEVYAPNGIGSSVLRINHIENAFE